MPGTDTAWETWTTDRTRSGSEKAPLRRGFFLYASRRSILGFSPDVRCFTVYRVLGVVFAACLIVQGYVWLNFWPIDHTVWVDGVHHHAHGRVVEQSHVVDQFPATTILLPAGALAAAGTSEDAALRLTMAFLLSLVAALTAAVAFLLRPATLWWAFVAWILIFQPLYTISTLPSGLLAPLAALFALLVLLARERNDYSLAMLARIGACGGAMLATRFETSAVFVAAATLFLASKRTTALYALPFFAVVSFLFFDPYFLFSPMEKVANFIYRLLFHALYFDKANALVSVTYASTFGIVALALAVVFLCTRRLSSIPPDFALFLAATSAAIIVALFISRHHPAWLFYPALLVWEMLLPFLVMDGIRALPEKGALQTLATRKGAGTVLAGVYMVYQVWLFQFRVF